MVTNPPSPASKASRRVEAFALGGPAEDRRRAPPGRGLAGGSEDGTGSALPLTGWAQRLEVEPSLRGPAGLRVAEDRPGAACISRAARLTLSPITVYSRRSVPPISPQ